MQAKKGCMDKVMMGTMGRYGVFDEGEDVTHLSNWHLQA